MLAMKVNKLPTIPKRNSDSEAMMLLAVAAASPRTIKRDGRYRRVNGANMLETKYNAPATLARTRGDISAESIVISIFPSGKQLFQGCLIEALNY
jgi:hypothetical protein